MAGEVATTWDMAAVISCISDAMAGIFEMAGTAFDFLIGNPLCAFMIGGGFCFVALGLVRKALRTAKRA